MVRFFPIKPLILVQICWFYVTLRSHRYCFRCVSLVSCRTFSKALYSFILTAFCERANSHISNTNLQRAKQHMYKVSSKNTDLLKYCLHRQTDRLTQSQLSTPLLILIIFIYICTSMYKTLYYPYEVLQANIRQAKLLYSAALREFNKLR